MIFQGGSGPPVPPSGSALGINLYFLGPHYSLIIFFCSFIYSLIIKPHHAQMPVLYKTYPSFITLCIRETPKGVLLHTVKTQMKCSKMLHFIRVYTVCKGKKDLQTKKYILFNFNLTPLDIYNGLSQVNCFKPEGRIH